MVQTPFIISDSVVQTMVTMVKLTITYMNNKEFVFLNNKKLKQNLKKLSIRELGKLIRIENTLLIYQISSRPSRLGLKSL